MMNFREQKALKELDAVSLAEVLRTHFRSNFSVNDYELLGDAINAASYLHRNHVRRGQRGVTVTPPYIEHPLRVTIRLFRSYGVSERDVFLAGIFHDTVEDNPFEFSDFEGASVLTAGDGEHEAREYALDFIAKRFGYRVAVYVEGLSNPILPKGVSKETKLASYREHMVELLESSHQKTIIKFSDFDDNPGSLHHHYEIGDPKIEYSLDRYEPSIPLFRAAFDRAGADEVYNTAEAHRRLDQIEKRFIAFREGLSK